MGTGGRVLGKEALERRAVLNQRQVQASTRALGAASVEMLRQVHADAEWILENLGVGCKQPQIQAAFRPFEAEGLAIVYEDRIFITAELIERCLQQAPGLDDFFVGRNSFFIGGTAPYLYDDETGRGGVIPNPEHAVQIARIAQAEPMVAGMGRGVKLKDESLQMQIMDRHCKKPLYFAVTSDAGSRQLQGIRWGNTRRCARPGRSASPMRRGC